jgi:hypothetical protein
MALGLRSTVQELLELGGEDLVRGTHQRPRGTPHAHFADACWIVMRPKKVNQMSQLARDDNDGIALEGGEMFKFLAPNDIQENIGHTWEEYESVSSRLANKVAAASKAIQEGGQQIKGLGTALKKTVLGKKDYMGALMSNVAASLAGQEIVNRKIDAGMTYTSSERRNLTLEFTLIDEGNPNFDIIDPINRLKRYSCADKSSLSSIHFSLPFVWEVYTEPQKWIHIKQAALIAVQPTFKGPFRNGLPSLCEVQLNFLDLTPLYRNTFDKTEKISVTSTLSRHIPFADKLNKFGSVTSQVQKQLDAYQKQYPGTLTDAGGKLSESITANRAEASKNWTNLLKSFQKGNTA